MDGYNLFRTVNGETELIAQRLGSKTNIERLREMNKPFSSYITTLFESAELDVIKMDALNVKSESEFQNKYITPEKCYIRLHISLYRAGC